MTPIELSLVETFFAPLAEAIGVRHGAADSAALFTLALGRWLPVTAIAPFFGAKSAPNSVRMGLAMLLAFTTLPLLSAAAPEPLALGTFAWWLLLLREAAIGVLFGFAAGMVFWGAEVGGRFIDSVRGSTVSNTLLPQTRLQTSMLGSFFSQLTIVLFLFLGGHRWFLGATFDSYSVLPTFPPGGGVPGLDVSAVVEPFIEATAEVLSLGVRFVAPSLAVVMLLDLVLGVANRMAPQLQVFFLSLSLKTALGALFIGLSMYLVGSLAERSFQSHRLWFERMVEQLALGGAV